jgi:formylglycine-generating enzyme required for sulfatase activity
VAVQHANQAAALVDRLRDAEIQLVPTIVAELDPFRTWTDPKLRELLTQGSTSVKEQLHAQLALLPVDPGQVEALRDQLLRPQTPVSAVLVIRQALLSHGDRLTTGLWQRVEAPRADGGERLRAACALAAMDPENPRWAQAGPVLVEHLLAENRVFLSHWMEAFRCVRLALLPSLARACLNPTRPAEQAVATDVLLDYAADQPEWLAEILTEADAGQFRKLFPVLRAHRARAIFLLQQELLKEFFPEQLLLPLLRASTLGLQNAPLAPGSLLAAGALFPGQVEQELDRRDALAKRQAQAAVALVQLGQAESVWPLLRHSPNPSRRTYLLHALGRLGTDPEVILQRLETEEDVGARRALILSLGEFTGDQLPAQRRRTLVERLLHWYRADPDPGIHSAVDWLLRYGRQGPTARKLDWQQAHALNQIDRELMEERSGNRRWYVTRQGHTLALMKGPVEFHMGSPEYELGRSEGETRHLRRIQRSFAVATKEVTVSQFRRFLETNPALKSRYWYPPKLSPADDGPQIMVSWFEAAQYCNWLSQQEGIPEDQWCYPKQIGEGMEIPADSLQRTGYRLPTEPEWEYACRAGATTTRFYGDADGQLHEYAWYNKTTNEERTWPVGQLKPNDLGLFDVQGNVHEWCHHRRWGYRTNLPVLAASTVGLMGSPPGQGPWIAASAVFPSRSDADITTKEWVAPGEDSVPVRPTERNHIARGGAFDFRAADLRSAERGWHQPNSHFSHLGFRVARTLGSH